MRTILALIASLSASMAMAQSQFQGWMTTLEDGQKLAAEKGKPLMIVFRCVR